MLTDDAEARDLFRFIAGLLLLTCVVLPAVTLTLLGLFVWWVLS